MRKRITVLLIALTIIVEGCGCMSLFKRASSSSANDIALAYMEEKYGEPFTYAGAAGNSMSGTHELFVSCDSLPGKEIKVCMYNFRSPDRTIADNYLMHKYEEDIKAMLLNHIHTEFSEANLYYSTNYVVLPHDLPADATLEQVLATENMELSATIEVRDHEFTTVAQAERVAQLVCDDVPNCFLKIIAVTEEEYGHLTAYELATRISTSGYIRAAVVSCSGDTCSSKWTSREE